jgi:hypothetical protein
MAESSSPTPPRTTSPATYNEVIKEVARRNEEGQKAARKRRAVREKEQLARRRQWERL